MNATGRKTALHKSCTVRSKRQKASDWILMAKFAATVKKRLDHVRSVPHKRAAARTDVLIWKPSMWAAARAFLASAYVAEPSLPGTCRRCTLRRVPANNDDSDENMPITPPAKTQGCREVATPKPWLGLTWKWPWDGNNRNSNNKS